MRRIIHLDKKPYFLSYASAGGFEESRGPVGEKFDITSHDDLFGMKDGRDHAILIANTATSDEAFFRNHASFQEDSPWMNMKKEN